MCGGIHYSEAKGWRGDLVYYGEVEGLVFVGTWSVAVVLHAY